jgi:hypothetical protein
MLIEHTDGLRIGGSGHIEVRHVELPDPIRIIPFTNLETAVGLQLVFDLLKNDTNDRLTHVGVGSNGSAVASNQTALLNVVFRASITKMTAGGGTMTISFFLPTTAANGITLREAGIFTQPSGGKLFGRVVHTDQLKTPTITLTYIWNIALVAV